MSAKLKIGKPRILIKSVTEPKNTRSIKFPNAPEKIKTTPTSSHSNRDSLIIAQLKIPKITKVSKISRKGGKGIEKAIPVFSVNSNGKGASVSLSTVKNIRAIILLIWSNNKRKIITKATRFIIL
ncbi:hypothetical protein K9M41_02065 [Candidatus Gracilibacteria bacterium]|nr:hypothetical protein [Candidatus Gracilibacteria bacterium]